MSERWGRGSADGTNAEPTLTVLGSINADLTMLVEQLPRPGETVLALHRASGLGGKGTNQAVAASLLGAKTTLLAAVGGDRTGDDLRARLMETGVDTRSVVTVDGVHSGQAIVVLDRSGENSIVVDSGANLRLTSALLEAHRPGSTVPQATTIGLSQGEVPAATIDWFAHQLTLLNARFVLNLAPVVDVASETLAYANPLIVNEQEAQLLARNLGPVGEPPSVDDLLDALAQVSRSVVITMGAAGAACHDDGVRWRQPAWPQPAVVDTTGAGDAFSGAVAASLLNGASLALAVEHAAVVSAYSVGRPGTTTSYPSSDQLAEFSRQPSSTASNC